MDASLKKDLIDKMDKALAILNKELSGLRTGRASINLLDPVVAEVYGSRMPLSQLATIGTPDATTITVQVWDKAMVKTVEKAIADANLGVNPSSDGQIIRISMPPLSEERRKELVKLAQKYGESSKVVMRNIRRDGMDVLKSMEKSNSISKDDMQNFSDEVQKITDDHTKKIDDIVKNKEQEIMKV